MLNDIIKIKGVYARSINLERDHDTEDLIDSYIPTSISLLTLKKIKKTFDPDLKVNRSWTLIGPYGSGKSSFGLFLSSLLSNPKSNESKISHNSLHSIDSSLSKNILNHVSKSKGYLKLLFSGSNESIKFKLATSLLNLLESLTKNKTDKVFLNELNLYKEKLISEKLEQKDIIDLVKNLETYSKKLGYRGIIIIFDELGKFIEYEVSQREKNDLHILQMIAEYCRSPKTNILFFGLLHQSFQHYSKSLSDSLKNEWTKIQGRFEEIPFVESTEQTLKIISQCFVHNLNKDQKQLVKEKYDKVCKFTNDLLANYGDETYFRKLLERCYPLHPLSSVILPILSQKIAQNERTIFSFITGNQMNSLTSILNKLNIGSFVEPYHIYDYFISNQASLISDSFTHRRWIEVSEAIERLEDKKYLPLLKTIGLFNIIGNSGQLKASIEALKSLSFPSLEDQLKYLQKKSLIKFRKYSGDYRIWEGSDFELENELNTERSKILNFSFIDEIYEQFNVTPIVVRRFSVEKGTLKTFEINFVDSTNYKNFKKTNEPKLIFFISFGTSDEKLFRDEIINYFPSPYVVSLFKGSDELQKLLKDKICLKNIAKRKELSIDRVAKREFDDLVLETNKRLNEIFSNIYDYPQNLSWYFENKQLDVKSKMSLQKNLSVVLGKVYPKMPIFNNEIINKNYLSVQGTAARNSLMRMMLNNETIEGLGIEKSPPEKSIYNVLLKEKGIHSSKSNLKFSQPTEKFTKFVWDKIDAYFKEMAQKPDTILNLINQLKAPPFGLKAGVLPILIFAYYLSLRNNIAIYHKRKYEPYFNNEITERFIKRPDEFTFQYLSNSDSTKKLYKMYSSILIKENIKDPKILDIAKPIARLMKQLSYYSKNTESLSPETKELRSAFYFAKTPQDFLDNEIPKIFKIDYRNYKKQSDFFDFEKRLANAFNELKNSLNNLILSFKNIIEEKFLDGRDMSLEKIRQELVGRYDHLWSFSIDNEGIKNFIGKITLKQEDINNWFLNLLMSLVHKPIDKWTDVDKENAELKLNEYSKKIIDLRSLKLAHDENKKESDEANDDVYIYKLQSIKPYADYEKEILVLEKNEMKIVNKYKEKIKNIFKDDNQIALKTLAAVTHDLIREKQNKKITKETKQKIKMVKG